MQLTRRGAARLTPLAILSTLALAGCNHSGTSDTGTFTAASGGSPMATVKTPKGNTLTITQPEFFAQLQAFTPNPNQQQFAGQSAGRIVLSQMLQSLLVEGLAQDQGVAPTDAEINTQYNVNKTIQEARTVKPYDQALADAGLTPDIIKELQVKPYLSQIKLATKGATVTDAEIQTYYNANKDKEFTKPNRVHIKRIVVATLPEAQAISSAIKGGQTFESQVPKSLDKTTTDGDIQQWVPLDPAPPQLATLIAPIKATAPGAVTPPIAFAAPTGQKTYWIVKVVEKKDKEVLSLDQSKDLIRAQLLQQKAQADPMAQQTLQQSLRDFQSSVQITIPEAQYASLVQELTHPAPPPPVPMGGGSPFTPAPRKP